MEAGTSISTGCCGPVTSKVREAERGRRVAIKAMDAMRRWMVIGMGFVELTKIGKMRETARRGEILRERVL